VHVIAAIAMGQRGIACTLNACVVSEAFMHFLLWLLMQLMVHFGYTIAYLLCSL